MTAVEALEVGDAEGWGLPAVGEVSEWLLAVVAGGQPVVLTRAGRPAAVVVDVDTYAEWEAAVEAS